MATGEVFIGKSAQLMNIQCAGLKSVPGQLRPPGFMFALRHFDQVPVGTTFFLRIPTVSLCRSRRDKSPVLVTTGHKGNSLR